MAIYENPRTNMSDNDQVSGIRRRNPDAPQAGPVSPEAYMFPGGAPPPPQPGNAETPRDRNPNQTPTTPLPGAPVFDQSGTRPVGPQRPTAAPSMPSSPSPVSAHPFPPMAPPQGASAIFGRAPRGSGLLGAAGGLLNGGLGVPQSSHPLTPEVSALIQQLLRRG